MKKIILTGALLTALVGGGAFAEEAKTKKPSKKTGTTITPEQRQNMASTHEKMAACLRSDKPMSECRTEMRKNCQDMMGKDGCPMGEMGGMMGGGMHHGGMQGQDDNK